MKENEIKTKSIIFNSDTFIQFKLTFLWTEKEFVLN